MGQPPSDIKKMGYIGTMASKDNPSYYLPIYSVDDIQLARASEWQLTQMPVGAQGIGVWKRQEAFTYPFDFDLIVGKGVRTYEHMDWYIRLFHSMMSHKFNKGEMPTPPEPVRFVIQGLVAMSGVILSGKTTLMKPFVIKGGKVHPTRVKFTGVFHAMPGLEANGIVYSFMNKDVNEILGSKHVQDNLYNIDPDPS